RSEPQVGIGFLLNSRSPLRRRSSIHSGSSFLPEMSRTTSSFRPRRAEAPASSESAQPNLYLSSPSSSGWAAVVIEQLQRVICSSRRAVVIPGPVGAQVHRADVGGADPVAVGDRGQPLHGGAEQPAERLGLGL